MPEMSGKFKSNPTKTSNLIYNIHHDIFLGGGKKNFATFKIFTPLYRILIYAPDFFFGGGRGKI